MTRLSFIILVAALAVAHGIEELADACGGMDDETCLFQTNIAVHKPHKTEMHQVLADLEEVALATPEGPVVLQELLDGVMALPPLKTQEAMSAAVHAQPQLQHLAERYPHLLHAMAMFEDPQKTEQIKAAVFQSHPSLMKMLGWQGRQPSAVVPAKRMPGDAGLLAFSQDQSAIMVWKEGWGCSAKLGFVDFPESKLPIGEVPIFGPDCAGWPSVSHFFVDIAAEGAYVLVNNYSSTLSANTHTIQFISEGGAKIVGKWTSDHGLYHSQVVFSAAANAYVYTETNGSWPNYTYQLNSVSLPESPSVNLPVTTLISDITDCRYPGSITTIAGTKDLLWRCSKDWNKVNDTYKMMKYSWEAKTSSVLAESDNMFEHITTIDSDEVFFSHWEERPDGSGWGSSLYGCSIQAGCKPVRLVDVASSYFVITESREAIAVTWDASWTKSTSSGKTYWTTYNMTSTDVMGDPSKSEELTKVLFQVKNYPSYWQIIVNKPGPEDILDEHSGPQGPPGPPGPPGAPGSSR